MIWRSRIFRKIELKSYILYIYIYTVYITHVSWSFSNVYVFSLSNMTVWLRPHDIYVILLYDLESLSTLEHKRWLLPEDLILTRSQNSAGSWTTPPARCSRRTSAWTRPWTCTSRRWRTWGKRPPPPRPPCSGTRYDGKRDSNGVIT